MEIFIKSGLILVLMVILTGCGGSSSVGSSAVNDTTESKPIEVPDPTNAPELSQETKDHYLKTINDARTKAGGQDCGVYGHFDPAPKLTWSDELYYASYEHSYDMAESDWFDHQGSGTDNDWTAKVQNLGRGSKLNERVENNNYKNWAHIGENISAGTDRDTPEEAVTSWMNSDGHCKNIMNPDFKEVGMAVVKEPDSKYTYYWTQDFGAKK